MSDNPSLSDRKSNAVAWWIAAGIAVVAVVGAVVLLSGARPRLAGAQTGRDQSRTEAKIGNAAPGARLAAVQVAKVAQAATATPAHATEAAARTGALSADATAQDASAGEPAPR